MVYGGPPLVVKTIESLTGIRIDYWMLTSFEDFARMVDLIGGLKMRILYPMHDRASGTNFERGERKLKGGAALAFARDRHSAPGGDFGRSFNQGRLIFEALKKFRDGFERDPTALFKWLRIGLNGVSTDLGLGEMIDLGLLAAQVSPNKVRNMVLPGSTGMAGAASIVRLSPSAQAIYRDVRVDGILNR
jgi:anionic cell wall polymer biosynthesis LytR-Cps2A-Psr (LCP) family protein